MARINSVNVPLFGALIAVVVYACAEHRASRCIEDKSGTLLPPLNAFCMRCAIRERFHLPGSCRAFFLLLCFPSSHAAAALTARASLIARPCSPPRLPMADGQRLGFTLRACATPFISPPCLVILWYAQHGACLSNLFTRQRSVMFRRAL